MEIELTGTPITPDTIAVPRMSGAVDLLPIRHYHGELHQPVSISGTLHSYNTADRHTPLFIDVACSAPATIPGTNQVALYGYICKSPILRTTPAGKQITNLLLAIPRENATSDYIPCIAWNGMGADLNIGDAVTLTGRLQSREYEKNHNTYTTHELSVSNIIVKNI